MEQGTFDLGDQPPAAGVKLCECKCGGAAPIAKSSNASRGAVKGQPLRFIQGHHAKLKAAQRAAERLAEPAPPVKLCECGCGEQTPLAKCNDPRRGQVKGQPVRFIRGHFAKLRAAQRAAQAGAAPVQPPTGICGCGCGEPTLLAKETNRARGEVKGQPRPFISGHRRFGPKPGRRKLFLEKGQKIGASTVLDPEARLQSRTRTVRAARLRCACGAEYTRQVKVIFRNPDTESCGCDAGYYADRTGQRFGSLTAVRMVRDKPRKPWQGMWWLCKCDCENEVVVDGGKLAQGLIKSCGCQNYGPREGYAIGEAAVNKLLLQYQKGAAVRSLAWELSRDDFVRLTSLNCCYCGLAPSAVIRSGPTSGAYIWNGLDRINNAEGYIPGNVAPCCAECNRIKGDKLYKNWQEWSARFLAFQFFSPEAVPAHVLAAQLAAQLKSAA
jgi:hypothetical protein